ncbi:hypothetical protein B296_00000183 [Ensete ventricosum]|uniref:Uncharacterized protein n=1 Tax=Ensete ventricosum TaxID=4639 RepID=A0A426ZMC8_ENSVE|nr:hypothetical protein B296_00000183 [Ensete ventricosum]
MVPNYMIWPGRPNHDSPFIPYERIEKKRRPAPFSRQVAKRGKHEHERKSNSFRKTKRSSTETESREGKIEARGAGRALLLGIDSILELTAPSSLNNDLYPPR